MEKAPAHGTREVNHLPAVAEGPASTFKRRGRSETRDWDKIFLTAGRQTVPYMGVTNQRFRLSHVLTHSLTMAVCPVGVFGAVVATRAAITRICGIVARVVVGVLAAIILRGTAAATTAAATAATIAGDRI